LPIKPSLTASAIDMLAAEVLPTREMLK